MSNKKHLERLRFNWHVQDAILDEFTYQGLVTMVRCNERIRDERAVRKCFSEMMESRLTDARDMLNLMMDKILMEIKSYEE